VTLALNGANSPAIGRTAVCVVRAESRGSGVLYSVTGNTDVEHHTLVEMYGHAADIRGTLELVRRFLEDVDVLTDLDEYRSGTPRGNGDLP
jgi:hypothetical protein